jgi:hypothetical protein
MHPAQAMRPEIELSGVIADHCCLGEETMPPDAAPQGALGGDADRGISAQRTRPQSAQASVCPPSAAVRHSSMALITRRSMRPR